MRGKIPDIKVRDIAVIVAVGIGFYYLHSYLVGYAAAIAAPDWFVPFMRENQIIGLAILSLMTTVPATAIAASVAGFALSKLVTTRHFVFGLLAVLVAILVATLAVDYGHGFFGNLRINAFPSHGYDLPIFLAIWFFLPLAALLFGRRIRQD